MANFEDNNQSLCQWWTICHNKKINHKPCPKDRHLWIIGHTGPVPDNGHNTATDLPAGT